MSKIPKLRFPEFSGEWEEKKLKNIVKINQGLQIPISERYLQNGENRYFYITNEFLKKTCDKKYYIENPSKNVICNEDDILMTRTGNTGKVITNVQGVFHNNFFKIDYEKEKVNKMFLVYTLTSESMQRKILTLAGTSTIPDLKHNDFYNIKIYCSNLSEQQKIASFFSTLDKKIEKQQEKVQALEKYKKGMMQKIFNQEIRFKDENGEDYPEWKNGNLSNVLQIPQNIKPEVISKDKLLTVKLHRAGVKVNKNVETLLIGSTSYYMRKAGQLIYGKQNFFNGAIGIIPNELDGYLSSSDVPTLDIKQNVINSNFLLNLIGRTEFYRKTEQLASGTGSKRLHEKTLLCIQVNIPSLQEQQKIAFFLSTLDKKIEKEQEKLDKLNELKKGLLQQMFV